MRSGNLLAALALLTAATTADAQGLLIPERQYGVPSLAMVSHRVSVKIDDQVASTTVEQTFRNHTSQRLEATYIFPVPKGASVNKFSMWVNGQETKGELLPAAEARRVYTEIVRRTRDPGLLEYLGNGMLQLKVFPIPPRGDQKLKLSYTSVAANEGGVVEYVYPMKTDGRTTRTLEDFTMTVSIKSQTPIQSVYSPTHAVTVRRISEREVIAEFEKSQSLLDKDFQLFYGVGKQAIGMTPIFYRPITNDDGYVMMLVSPQVETAGMKRVPRDLVMVLDTSGSMSDQKMDQAKKALRFCLSQLKEDDRFALIGFSTTVQKYKDSLAPADTDNLERARKWVSDLQAGGGTAILPALLSALEYKPTDGGRSFTVVFFTDGMPTVDETNPERIVKAIQAKNTAGTRIFTFGVGDDVNAQMLDQLADATRAASTYVRPAEDIEVKVSSLYAKIHHPALTDVTLTASNVQLLEIYPPKLPDLFYGQQLVVIGRYSGQGPAAIKLSGTVGSERQSFVYETTFPRHTEDEKSFVEPLWARRKVGYLLDQIRSNGQSQELVNEVMKLARRYGIATPYTSYLVVPDAAMPVARPGGLPRGGGIGAGFGGGISGGNSGIGGGIGGISGGIGGISGGIGGIGGGIGGMPPGGPQTAAGAARGIAQGRGGRGGYGGGKPGGTGSPDGGIAAARGYVQNKQIDEALKQLPKDNKEKTLEAALNRAKEQNEQLAKGGDNYQKRDRYANQTGKLGVDLAEAGKELKGQSKLTMTANRLVNGRNCVEIGGLWIDDKFEAKQKLVVVKAQSEAYFRILEKHPGMKDVYRLGNYVVWTAPSGQALVIDVNDGKEKLDDAEIDALFAKK
ncbi:MAG TPA: VIT domain-containing protein [Fimbriiglobus sp.]|jgi:Ca-activated chloride channel family protein